MTATEPTTVWTVCEDEYESNGPIAAFTSEELANKHCAVLNAESRGTFDVRPLPLLSSAPDKVTWYHRQASIRSADGAVLHYGQPPRQGWRYDHEHDPELLIVHPRVGMVINAYATSDAEALAACSTAVRDELAKREQGTAC